MNGNQLKNGCRALWEQVFNDSPAFVDLYFERRFSEERTFYAERGGRVVCAMQSLPYTFNYLGKTLPVGYVSGLATLPAFRRQGLASYVLRQSHDSLRREGAAFSFLIPADDHAARFYRNHGYTPCFRKPVFPHLPPGEDVERLTPDVVRFIQDQMGHRENYIGHSRDDIADIFTVARMDGGGLRLQRKDGHICSATIFDRAGGNTRVLDQFTDSSYGTSPNAPCPAHNFQTTAPIGMAKLLDTAAIPDLDTLRALRPVMSLMLD